MSSHSKAVSPGGGGKARNDQVTNAKNSQLDEQVLEQQRQEIAELREALAAQKEENALLNEVISTVGSTLLVEEVLHHLVETIVRAISCHAAFIYLYDKEKERLTLASTSEQYRHLMGKIELAVGEGIVGWVALTLKPVILKDEAMDDPRFHYFPDLEEEKFQSTLTVPIVGKDRHLIGVITMHTVAPYEFTEQQQVFVSNTAALVAGSIENAQLYESTQRKLSILTSLAVLSQTISSGLYLDDMLRSLAMLTVQILETDLCVIMLMDQARGRLVMRASSPGLSERALNFQSVDVDRSAWERLNEMNEALKSGPDSSRGEMSSPTLDPLHDTQFKALISAPLIAGTEHLGLINCYSSKARRFTAEDQTLLTTIAYQAAMAIKNSHLAELLAQKNLVKGFFDDLMHGTYDSEDALRQRANFLGCDLSKQHTIVMIELSQVDEHPNEAKLGNEKDERTPSGALPRTSFETEEDRLAAHKRISSIIRRRIQESYPGSVIYEHENLLTCMICVSKDPSAARLKSWLRDLSQQMSAEHNVHLSIGIGNSCQQSSDYRRGYAEASEALQLGPTLNRESDITHFNDLGVNRYLYKIARMDSLRDMYQDEVARIASYDRRKGTDLLDTLETYLECAGNLTKTSNRLFVHRNTLIQRLERLQSLCEIDIQERSNWLTLQVAIKVYKLRQNAAQ